METSAIDGTQKYLFRLADGNVIESVLDALPSRKFRLYLLPGGLPDGLPVLCLPSAG